MNRDNLLTWIELSRSALSKNIASLTKLAAGRDLAVCVKANGYGHGLPEMVSLLIPKTEVTYLSVHSIEEATLCRENGWDRKIMLLGPFARQRAGEILTLDLEPLVSDKSALTAIGKVADKANKQVRTHLKLETGTGRQGVTEPELTSIAEIYHKYDSLKKPYGAATHFANIEDTTNHEYAEFQIDNFRRMLHLMGKLKIKPQIRHTACSAALILFEKTRYELVRPGIAAYGHWPSKETYLSYRLLGGENDLFAPVLSWKTRVAQIKKLPADSFVGYGCSYRTTAPTKLAVLPIGYSDGYDRLLSNTAYVLIKGKRAPIRGRVCMNLTLVDITDIKGVKVGDVATLLGWDQSENVTAEQLSDWALTINYETLSRISKELLRVIVE